MAWDPSCGCELQQPLQQLGDAGAPAAKHVSSGVQDS